MLLSLFMLVSTARQTFSNIVAMASALIYNMAMTT